MEPGLKRRLELGFGLGLRWRVGLKPEQEPEPGSQSSWCCWCCCRSGGWRSGGAADDAGGGGGCGGEGWRREAGEELGVGCCGGNDGDSWLKWGSMWSELVEAAEEEEGEEARGEEQVEEEQQVAGPNAGPCSLG